jgi:hypothetical protein
MGDREAYISEPVESATKGHVFGPHWKMKDFTPSTERRRSWEGEAPASPLALSGALWRGGCPALPRIATPEYVNK